MNALVKLCLAALAFVPRHSCVLHVPTYEWIDDVAGTSVTCDRCPPGTRMVTHCSKNRPTKCCECPDLHYTESWNYLERCRYCNVFCTENQFEKSPCNATHNRVCECKSGYYSEDGFCRRHSTCPPGQGVSRNGTAHVNVKCSPCEEGYYSSEHSNTNPCLKHSMCKAEERPIPGNEKMDTFCTLCHAPSSSADQAVCDRAVIDYVSQYPLHTRKHKRLENTLFLLEFLESEALLLAMDEESLEAAIATYRAQLQQVDMALGLGMDPSQQADLVKLKEDLHQLIDLTESSLVSVKKSRLLASLEDSGPVESSAKDGLDNEFAAFYSELGELAPDTEQASATDSPRPARSPGPPTEAGTGEGDDDDDNEEDSMSGMKVRAPYRTTWGTLEYHNAMVVGAEDCDGTEPCVRVLYIHPTHKSMKPCPYFLQDKCRFMEECRFWEEFPAFLEWFSHGAVVSVSELREFEDLDLSNLQEGSPCLALYEDGIWYPARITGIKDGFYTVKFDSLLQGTSEVEADGIIPPLRPDDPTSSDSDDDDRVLERSAYAKVLDSTEGSEWTPSSCSSFAGWEAHTRGIGSKLMVKMGYEFGKGLGRGSDGRVEPVAIVVLPKGKSLDQCAEIIQKAAQKKQGKTEGPKGRRKGKRGGAAREGRGDVFDFLNSKLGDRKQSTEADAHPRPGSSKDAYKGGQSLSRSLNVRLFQATEQATQTEREILRLTQAIARQAGRDKKMVTKLEAKLAAARQRLIQLKAQEQSMQQEQRKANTHKIMTKF
ncbi:hypothetical protein GJAV_G00184350 [Gymnothorax javanicus]|nr:hypothetical protein GJAV_G00184350 [Gymnothorax javanicus]